MVPCGSGILSLAWYALRIDAAALGGGESSDLHSQSSKSLSAVVITTLGDLHKPGL